MFLSLFRTAEALLKAGADPNLGDDFSNVYQMSKEKQMNSLHGSARNKHGILNTLFTIFGVLCIHNQTVEILNYLCISYF